MPILEIRKLWFEEVLKYLAQNYTKSLNATFPKIHTLNQIFRQTGREKIGTSR